MALKIYGVACSRAFRTRWMAGDLGLQYDAWGRQARVDLAALPKAEAWLQACHDRPAAKAARQLQREG